MFNLLFALPLQKIYTICNGKKSTSIFSKINKVNEQLSQMHQEQKFLNLLGLVTHLVLFLLTFILIH